MGQLTVCKVFDHILYNMYNMCLYIHRPNALVFLHIGPLCKTVLMSEYKWITYFHIKLLYAACSVFLKYMCVVGDMSC